LRDDLKEQGKELRCVTHNIFSRTTRHVTL
jgi:hypothetical protein